MDSSNKSFPQISSSNSSKSSKALNPVYFSGPYHHQNWSFPDSIIFYISKNPSSAKLFQKLVQMCKYFFIKNPIIVIEQFNNRGKKELEVVLEKTEKRISYKFWISGDEIQPTSKIISSIVPHIYKVDVKKILVSCQTISFNDFVCFSKNVENLDLNYIRLKKEKVSNIPLEKLVEALPELKNLYVNQNFLCYLITSETMKELVKIEHFSKINSVRFSGLADTFDVEIFYDYMKKNKHTLFYFDFDYLLSDAYINRLKEIIDEVIEIENHDYKVPYFTAPYPFLDTIKWSKMQKLYYSQ
uniref:Uncharacterized protein n=1 Tax=Panagrolaimus davidi TaxID=227884 RepID=A0A914QFQ9_9BILA